MKKAVFIASLALVTSIGVFADGGKKSKAKKEKAKTECCQKSKGSSEQKPGCCDMPPSGCDKKS